MDDRNQINNEPAGAAAISDDVARAAGAPTLKQLLHRQERHESYTQLVWRKFTKSKAAIFGALIVLSLGTMALFAEFFAPYPLPRVEPGQHVYSAAARALYRRRGQLPLAALHV